MSADRRPDGIVLAGGPGSRVGRPKAGLTLGGETLVERAVAMLVPRCRRVVVLSRAEVALPPLPVPVLFDRPGPDAPIVAVATGLAALSSEDCVVLGCDLPLAGPAVDGLLAAPAGIAVVARDPSGRLQPLCARYPRKAALAACERLIAAGELRMGRLLRELDPLAVDAPGDALLNVNTEPDLARAASLLRG